MTYYTELTRAMQMLGEHPRAVFLGQAVAEKGTGMSASFATVPREKLWEFPVAEDMQMGMSTGLALDGWLPVSIFPRWSFLLCAANQLVLHLDKLPLYSDYRPRVIIRTAVPTDEPLNPGPQHLGDFTIPFQLMLKSVRIVSLLKAADIVPEYLRAAMTVGHSTILVERTALYGAES